MRIFILYWMWDETVTGDETVTEDEEKTEVFYGFLSSVLNSKTSCSGDTQLPELEERDGEQNEALISQEEMVSDLWHHLDIYKSAYIWERQVCLTNLISFYGKVTA
ncbi:hypothetical protein WISP_99659 [Willisornis vidua]|uniref:Uncharacterized protein n=1 Tax=Willisornis vidua TaxID=1566151 RepID=A0ABQ9CZ37_9PASS|nr:hypothetical protein WISP_99659 [Willisornis vidua]